MKRLALLGISAALGGCQIVHSFSTGIGGPELVGNGVTKEESRSVSEFDKINVSSAFEVVASEDSKTAVTITADENVLSHIKSEVKSGTLNIWIEGSLSNSGPLKVVIKTPKIMAFEGSGATRTKLTLSSKHDLELEGSGASKTEVVGPVAGLRCDLSGASQAKISTRDLENVKLDLSGASHFDATGTVKEFEAKLSGASQVTGGLSGEKADLELSGASNATIGNFGQLSKEVSGASNIRTL